jgi:hypothetical protein
VDVRQDAAAGDGDGAQELVQLLVVADGELDVARDDARLLHPVFSKTTLTREVPFLFRGSVSESGSFRSVMFGYNI